MATRDTVLTALGRIVPFVFVAAFLIWFVRNLDLFVALAVGFTLFYGAIQLFMRWAEWYTSDYPPRLTPSTASEPTSLRGPDRKPSHPNPVVTRDYEAVYGPWHDETLPVAEWQLEAEEELERRTDRERSEYCDYENLYDEGPARGCAADYEWEYGESGEGKDGRW